MIILFGAVLDCLIGEPQNPFHPVCLIARFAKAMERLTRKIFPEKLKLCGFLTWIATLAVTCSVSGLLLYLLSFHFLSCLIGGGILVYFCICPKGLCTEADKVLKKLLQNDLAGARNQLSMIVGRDTQNLSEKEILLAVIETVAENFSDGVVAPLFYILLFGPLGGLLYKAVNTMDSLFGYRNDAYLEFGFVPARMDDLFNWIPARISAILTMIASPFCGCSVKNSYRIWKRDRRNHLSPNSAQPESAFAGALSIQMGGTHSYGGQIVEKPTIGNPIHEPDFDFVHKAKRLMLLSSLFWILLTACLKFFIWEMRFL